MYDVGGENLIKDSLFFNNTLVFSCPSDDCYNKSVGIYIEKTYCGNFTTCDTPVPPQQLHLLQQLPYLELHIQFKQ